MTVLMSSKVRVELNDSFVESTIERYADLQWIPFCELVQSDRLGEPVVKLQRYPDGRVETFTIQECHMLLEEMGHTIQLDMFSEAWSVALSETIEGIR
jgi:hypothetical protein